MKILIDDDILGMQRELKREGICQGILYSRIYL